MLIRSVYVKQFATLNSPLRIDFDEGLNLIVGDNETGKSTLMRAIWFAFTRRARSQAQDIKSILPYTGGTPEVHVALTENGASYLLKKRFDSSDELTHLEVQRDDGTQDSWQGDEADRQIRRLLGFGKASGRTGKPSHFGMWPVTWVRQGDSGIDPGERLSTEGNTETLTTSLSEITGDVLAGTGGADLLHKASEEYGLYFTSSGNKTTRQGSPLYEAEKEQEEAEEALAELEERQQKYERDIEQYKRCQEQLRALQEDFLGLKQEAEDAREKAERVDTLRGQLETAETKAESAKKEAERRKEHLAALEKLRSEIESLEGGLEKAEGHQAECDSALEEHRKHRTELKKRFEETEERRDEATRRSVAAEARLALLRDEKQVSDLQGKIEQASTHQDERAEVSGKLSNLTVDQETLERLEELNEDVRDAQATLQAAAAKITVHALEESVAFELDGHEEHVEAGERCEWQVDTLTEFKIANLVQIDVTPGGKDLETVREQASASEEALQEALSDAQVESFKEARQCNRQKERLEAERERLDALIELHAPEGVTKLQEELAAAQQRKEDAEKKFDGLKPSDEVPDLPENLASAMEEKEALQGEKVNADQAYEAARQQWQEHESTRSELESELRLAEQAVQNAKEKLESTKEEIEEVIEERGDREALQENLDLDEEQLESAEARVADLEKELRDIGADQIDGEKERAEDALQAAKGEEKALHEQQIQLETKLGSADLHGLHSRLSEKRQRKVETGEKVERMERRAQAARLLHETLQAKRGEAQRRHQAPLREEIRKLLKHFFRVEDGNVQFGEGFDLKSVSRSQNGKFEFDQLSGGAKEQMSLLVRLAMAGVIAGDVPLPIFLDDPLSETDAVRFKAMATVLRSMSEDMQVIVTTCHRDRYRQLGAHDQIDLEAYKSRSHTPPSL